MCAHKKAFSPVPSYSLASAAQGIRNQASRAQEAGWRKQLFCAQSAASLLPNLETARGERSVMLLDEQKLLVKEEEVGLLEYQNGFYELLTKPESDLVWPCPDVLWMNVTV
jgi:hypothetical protein